MLEDGCYSGVGIERYEIDAAGDGPGMDWMLGKCYYDLRMDDRINF